jgi:hypothetical protein
MAWRCVLVSVGSAEGSEVGCVECRKERLGFFLRELHVLYYREGIYWILMVFWPKNYEHGYRR